MGGGSWSDVEYARSVKGNKAFVYSDEVLRRPRAERRCHQLLDPFDLKIRESRDSAEHPESNAVMIGLDVTGSMANVVISIRDSLGGFMETMLNENYIPDPQVLFYAIGDATCDDIPFQISQFESDIRINDQLTRIILEGGGGSGLQESYELGFYCASFLTSIDCFEKRNRKGYLFSIGDEMPYSEINRNLVKKVFNIALQENLTLETVAQKAREKYHIFHIIPKGSNCYGRPEIRNFWERTLGGEKFVFMLENAEATANLIALVIGLNEGKITLEEGLTAIADKLGQSMMSAIKRSAENFAVTVQNRLQKNIEEKDIKEKLTKLKKDKKNKDWKL